jgi:hypothetical protein
MVEYFWERINTTNTAPIIPIHGPAHRILIGNAEETIPRNLPPLYIRSKENYICINI